MRFSAVSAAALAFAASALADTTAGFDVITNPGQTTGSITAGQSFTLQWTPGSYTTGTVTISLIGGADSAHLTTVETIATDVDSSAGTYAWAVESTLGDLATYGIQITLNSNTSIYQYSFPFTITGGSSSGSSSSGSSSSAASTSSVASYSTGSAVVSSSSVVSSYSTAAVSSTLSTVTTTGYSTGGSATGSSSAPVTTITSVATKSTASASKTASATTTVATGAAHHVTAGYMALFGGLAAVVFAQ